jgi:hypothetical protein
MSDRKPISADFALGVAARQGDGRDAALLALKRIDRAHAEPALQGIGANLNSGSMRRAANL